MLSNLCVIPILNAVIVVKIGRRQTGWPVTELKTMDIEAELLFLAPDIGDRALLGNVFMVGLFSNSRRKIKRVHKRFVRFVPV